MGNAGRGEILCKAKKVLEIFLQPVSFLVASAPSNAGEKAVNAAEDFKDQIRGEVEEAIK